MIDPAFIATLRQQHNCQHLLLWIQLEQLAPNWWANQNEMADQLGIQRASLFRGLHWLREHDLIRTCGSNHGTYLWWVKAAASDLPNETDAPAWILKDRNRMRDRITLGREREWCAARGVNYRSFGNFACGRIKTLHKRWTLVGTPWDLLDDGNLTTTPDAHGLG